jgi:hypothetical protein
LLSTPRSATFSIPATSGRAGADVLGRVYARPPLARAYIGASLEGKAAVAAGYLAK